MKTGWYWFRATNVCGGFFTKWMMVYFRDDKQRIYIVREDGHMHSQSLRELGRDAVPEWIGPLASGDKVRIEELENELQKV